MIQFHFLNVGKGNCTLIEFPSYRLSIIDIDDSQAVSAKERAFMQLLKEASLTNPTEYVTSNFLKKEIFRFILTHPDMDHMSGIKELFNKVYVRNFWDPPNNKPDPEDWEISPYKKDDWDFYQQLKSRKVENLTVISPLRNAKSDCCWVQDNIRILSPSEELITIANNEEDWNISSYVFMIEYQDNKILLGGDATQETWSDIIKNYDYKYLESDIFLAPHHGSKNNISTDILDIVKPRLVIVSVAKGVDYDRDTYSRYGVVLSTKYYGNIQVKIIDGDIFIRTQFQNYSDTWYVLRERAFYYT